MGVSASLSNNVDVNYHLASEAVEQCEICDNDSNGVSFCKECQKSLCSTCCQHLAEAEKRKRNPFFGQIPSLVASEFLDASNVSSKAVYKKVRCGALAWNGRQVLVCQLFYDNKYCECCDKTSKWKLYLDKAKPLYLTKRIHKDEEFIHPGDICYVEVKRKLYLTLPCKQKVFKMSSVETFRDAFSTPLGSCFGITSFSKGLAVSIRISTNFAVSKWQVQLTDYKGNIKSRLHHDTKGNALFLEPLFLTSNQQEDILFVSDHEKHSVLAFKANGDFIFEYADVNMKFPLGIAADVYNNVYVACGKKVIQIENCGKDSKELLSITNEETIVSVCIDCNTDTLITISDWGNVTKFDFSKT